MSSLNGEAGLGSVNSTSASVAMYAEARKVVPGGVQGQGRRRDPYPIYMRRADGSRIWDVDGTEYLDFHSGFGSVLLGHNAPEVRDAITAALDEHGVTFATANPLEVRLAERIVQMVPSAEKAVFACTGTEATYHAIRLARAATGRTRILKLEGHYHGWHDYVAWSVRFDPAIAAQTGPSPAPLPSSTGIPPELASSVLIGQYNDPTGIANIIEAFPGEIAALILEPLFFNGGVVLPEPGFLEACRQICTDAGIILIFDEVISGFRVSPGGAQELVGVTPDLTTLGKAVANGFPLSVLTGRADLMSLLVPEGDVLFAGTFAGHVLNVAAALACTEALTQPGFYSDLEHLGRRLESGLAAMIAETGTAAQFVRFGSVWTLYFSTDPIKNYRDVYRATSGTLLELQATFRDWMLRHGVYIHPHHILRGYLTAAHTDDDIERLISLCDEFFRTPNAALA